MLFVITFERLKNNNSNIFVMVSHNIMNMCSRSDIYDNATDTDKDLF